MTATDAGTVAPDDECADLLDLAAGVARQAVGGEQVEAFVGRSSYTTVKAHGGEVESFSSATTAGMGIRVVRDHRQGFAWAGSLDPDVVAETLAEARDNAAFAQPDEWVGLADPDGVAPVPFDAFDPAVAALAPERKVALALELEAMVRGGDPRITGVRVATFSDSSSRAAVASSTGIAGASRSAWCSMGVLALAAEGDETYTGSGSTVGFGPDDLDLDEAATDAVTRAVRLFGARPVSSRRLSVVLEPRMAAAVVGLLGGTLTGDRVLKGRSPFADRLGDTIAVPGLTLVDDPTDHRSFAAETFDGEGLACRRNVLVADGVLQGFLYDSATGRRAGHPSTGSAVRGVTSTPSVGCQALAVTPGAGTHDELVGAVDLGVEVQSITGWHSGVNAISGDLSVGVEGVMIRDGQRAEPVREVTIASTLQKMLLGIDAIGGEVEWLPGGTGCPTLVFGDISLSGT
ncbi:TldD/PmbA family protein [Rhabdothermincola salaria]|uniref:TldD/PmbA family protein n=1 Tax=Rhabdothermincola salaria TaxID=2903142 RepID=UPI001E332567|nr:TldD/PmbA family protein [Rhabdothermincola salaria]MCD9623786.1 TldD/PmbA family protein [Rhabdothermincola salaria]